MTSVYGSPAGVNPSVTFSTRPATMVAEWSMRSTMFIGFTVVAWPVDAINDDSNTVRAQLSLRRKCMDFP